MDAIKQFFERDHFAQRAGIRLLEVAPGRATAQMLVGPEHWNGIEGAHGGALFTLADFAFAAAANSHGTVAVAINASIAFVKSVQNGLVRADAREVARSFKVGTYQVELRDETGDLVAVFQGMVYRKRDALPGLPPAAS
ncbi:MAG TPA: hotdog fold thioesterase [Verrucomicrobiota bacterium]|nr:hotdog fold thioesterase [Verrucomicrobiota bacterium]HNU49291.1 hotdog fold thioesterase [Verrucomicrobiota bacterium]